MKPNKVGTTASEEQGSLGIIAMAAEQGSPLHFKPMRLKRRAPGPNDVVFDLTYSGVCHTDVHIAADHFKRYKNTNYPCVPGHELSGVVTAIGANVSKFAAGDLIGVGCFVDSCLNCRCCHCGDDHKCVNKTASTYNGQDFHGRAAVWPPGSHTLGGYSDRMVVHERFGVKIPPTYSAAHVGPVMCAGVTMFSPLKRFGAKQGTKVGIAGLGGLGMTGIKIAKALGCEVTALSRTTAKEPLSRAAGADNYLAMSDGAAVRAARKSLDLILDTIPAAHDVGPYVRLLKAPGKDPNCKHVCLGICAELIVASLVFGGKPPQSSPVTASMIGSIQETQEIIDLCDKHKIFPEIIVRPVDDLNRIFEDLDRGNDKGVRYVLDIKGSLTEARAFGAGAVQAGTIKSKQEATEGQKEAQDNLRATTAAVEEAVVPPGLIDTSPAASMTSGFEAPSPGALLKTMCKYMSCCCCCKF